MVPDVFWQLVPDCDIPAGVSCYRKLIPMFGRLIRSKRVRRLIYIILLLLVTPLVVLWFVLTQPMIGRNQPSEAVVDAEKLKEHVLSLSETFHPRSFDHPENLDRCADYIAAELKQSGGRVSFQNYDYNRQTYRNVRALFGPADDASRIVAGAHYDAVIGTPGADDNASAVAGLIELGFLLGKNEASLKQTVELVAYTLEEPPFFESSDMGSYRHAKLLHEQGVEIRLMICLEMIGYFDDTPGSQSTPLPVLKLFYPDRGNFIAVVGRLDQPLTLRSVKKLMRGSTDLPVYSITAPMWVPGVALSDHRNYWQFDYPAVMITDTAFFRNTAYHSGDDTADRLDYDRMGKVVIDVFEVVMGFAGE